MLKGRTGWEVDITVWKNSYIFWPVYKDNDIKLYTLKLYTLLVFYKHQAYFVYSF